VERDVTLAGAGPDAATHAACHAIILMGRHKDRTDLGTEFGATDVVAERGAEGIARVRDLTGGDGTHTVLECVGHLPAVRNYIEELVPDVLEGKVEPGRVFDRTVGLSDTPDGYRAMDRREALKVIVRP
jgi:threonine dehydrogenase-like Zn-dependent dehydrogenase